jgi:hypothetical protein
MAWIREISEQDGVARAADARGVELDPMLGRLARSAPDGKALTDVAASRRS